jgi:D-arabinose 1-dehydrogenase-like Zn-dependent alcohol dehydrogenase
MRAIILESFDSSPALHEVPTPQIAPNELLVRVHASSVNPVDGAIAAGMMSGMVDHEFPVVLGRDYAGVVERAGEHVTRYTEGEEVYGFVPAANPTVHDGTWAELIVVPEDNFVARKPDGVELAEAGAAPLAAITAMSALDALGVSKGDTALVVGANGGVGSFAVQLAANAGTTIIAPDYPKTSNTYERSASTRYSIATSTSPRSCTSATPTASRPSSTSSPTPQKASTPTRRSSRTTAVAPRRTRRPAKDRGVTTSGRCRARRTWSAWGGCWRTAPSECPSRTPIASIRPGRPCGR